MLFDRHPKQCLKVAYQSKAEANADIKRMVATTNHFNKKNKAQAKCNRKKHAYKCNKCGNWHITTLAKNVTRKFERAV